MATEATQAVTFEDFIVYLAKIFRARLSVQPTEAECQQIFWNLVPNADNYKNSNECGVAISIGTAVDICNKFLESLSRTKITLDINKRAGLLNSETAKWIVVGQTNTTDNCFLYRLFGCHKNTDSSTKNTSVVTSEIGDLVSGSSYTYIEITKGTTCDIKIRGGGGGGSGIVGAAVYDKKKTAKVTHNGFGSTFNTGTASSAKVGSKTVIADGGAGGTPGQKEKSEYFKEGGAVSLPTSQANGSNGALETFTATFNLGDPVVLTRGNGGDGGCSGGNKKDADCSAEIPADRTGTSSNYNTYQSGGRGGGNYTSYMVDSVTYKLDVDSTSFGNVLTTSTSGAECRYGYIGEAGGGNTKVLPGRGGYGGTTDLWGVDTSAGCDADSGGSVTGATGGGGGYIHGALSNKSLFIII